MGKGRPPKVIRTRLLDARNYHEPYEQTAGTTR